MPASRLTRTQPSRLRKQKNERDASSSRHSLNGVGEVTEDAMATAYDELAYPTAIFNQTQPDRLATIARLTGLNPPPVATARTLEIGGGDGMNLVALATAWPDAEFVNFDLASTAIERGREWIAKCSLSNIRMEALDILEAAQTLEGSFDYIIAHGVYAWVPPDVREATMALIGKLLSPNGIAFLSYNAMPGGYMRLAIRDALLMETEGLTGAAKWNAARSILGGLAEPREGDENPSQAAFRDAAQRTLDKPWSVLNHDELGDSFYPQSLIGVTKAAAKHGLQFLGDADCERLGDAFLPEFVDPEPHTTRQLVQLLQEADYRDFRYFRQTLLVRDGVQPRRRIDQAALASLHVSTRCHAIDDNHFKHNANTFEIRDPALAEALTRLAQSRPVRLRVDDLADSDARRTALFEMFNAGLVQLHSVDSPFVSQAGEWPCASKLARQMIDADLTTICTLDQRLMAISDHGPRHLMQHLDGSRDRAALAPIAAEAGLGTPDALEHGLATLAREALLVA